MRNADPAYHVGIQCKLKTDGHFLTADEARDEVREALTFRPELKEYFITTTSPDDVALQELARELAVEQKSKGRSILFYVWGWNTLEERISEDAAARKEFNPDYGAFSERILNDVGKSQLSSRTLRPPSTQDSPRSRRSSRVSRHRACCQATRHRCDCAGGIKSMLTLMSTESRQLWKAENCAAAARAADPSNEELASYLVQAARFAASMAGPLDLVPYTLKTTAAVEVARIECLEVSRPHFGMVARGSRRPQGSSRRYARPAIRSRS